MYDTPLQVTFDSAVLVTKYIQNLSSFRESNLLDVWVVKAVIHILSIILKAQIPSSRLTLDVLHITTESVLVRQRLLEHQHDLHLHLQHWADVFIQTGLSKCFVFSIKNIYKTLKSYNTSRLHGKCQGFLHTHLTAW